MLQKLLLLVAVLLFVPSFAHAEYCFGRNIQPGYLYTFNITAAGAINYAGRQKDHYGPKFNVRLQGNVYGKGSYQEYAEDCGQAQAFVEHTQKSATRKLKEAYEILLAVQHANQSHSIPRELRQAAHQFTSRHTPSRFEGKIYVVTKRERRMNVYKNIESFNAAVENEDKRFFKDHQKDNRSDGEVLIEGVLKGILQGQQ